MILSITLTPEQEKAFYYLDKKAQEIENALSAPGQTEQYMDVLHTELQLLRTTRQYVEKAIQMEAVLTKLNTPKTRHPEGNAAQRVTPVPLFSAVKSPNVCENKETMKPLEQEFDYYLKNQESLVEKYNGMYLVIKENEILGAYDSEELALFTNSQVYEIGTFLIQYCSPGEEAYTQERTAPGCELHEPIEHKK